MGLELGEALTDGAFQALGGRCGRGVGGRAGILCGGELSVDALEVVEREPGRSTVAGGYTVQDTHGVGVTPLAKQPFGCLVSAEQEAEREHDKVYGAECPVGVTPPEVVEIATLAFRCIRWAGVIDYKWPCDKHRNCLGQSEESGLHGKKVLVRCWDEFEEDAAVDGLISTGLAKVSGHDSLDWLDRQVELKQILQ